MADSPAISTRRNGRSWVARFFRKPVGVLGLAGVVLVLAVSIVAPQLAPHDPARQYFDGLTLSGDPLPPSWVLTCWAATCCPASYTARGCRCSSG